MRDLKEQIRDYLDEAADPVTIEDVFFARAGHEKVRPVGPSRRPADGLRRPWLIGAAAFVVVLLVGAITVLVEGGPASTTVPPATDPPITTVTPTTVAGTTTTQQPGTSVVEPAGPLDLEAAALGAIAGAGTMLVYAMPDDSLWPLEPTGLFSAVERDVYLDLAPLPETRLQDGAVWLASLPDAAQATLLISQATSAYREPENAPAYPNWFPISEFDVPGIDGARGFLGRELTGRGGPSSFPNATVWFQVDAVVAAVDINFGGDFVDDEWPIDYAAHLATWVHSSLSAQMTGQQASGPDAPVAAPPSDYELEGVALLEGFYRAIVTGDMDSAWALVDIERPGPGCGEGCQADNWDMNVVAPVFATLLDPFDATADILGCAAVSTRRVQVHPGDDGFRDAVDVRCLFQVNGDPWLEALGISSLVEIDGQVVPGELIVNLPSIPRHPGVESVEYKLLMLARHAGSSDPETLASVCVFDPDNPDEQLAWSVETESPVRRLLEETCWTFAGEFENVVIPSVP